MSADIVNLKRARKHRARAAKTAQAAENRVRFGRTKAEKEAAQDDAARKRRNLDGHRHDRLGHRANPGDDDARPDAEHK